MMFWNKKLYKKSELFKGLKKPIFLYEKNVSSSIQAELEALPPNLTGS